MNVVGQLLKMKMEILYINKDLLIYPQNIIVDVEINNTGRAQIILGLSFFWLTKDTLETLTYDMSIYEELRKAFENGECDDLTRKFEIQDQNEQRYIKFIHDLDPEERHKAFVKIKRKYESPEYIDSEYKKGIFPRTELYEPILGYAEIYGEELESPEFCCTGKYLIDGKWIVERFDGQGTIINLYMVVKFNLDLWKPDDRIFTRNGHLVRIICTDYKGETGYSVIGLVQVEETGEEIVQEYMKDGSLLANGEESELDLYTEATPMYLPGDLVVSEMSGYLILIGESDDPRIIESTITINPGDLSEVIEDSFDPSKVRSAEKQDYDDLDYYLALLGLEWEAQRGNFKQIDPELDFTPTKNGWEVTYNGRTKELTDKEYKELYGTK